MSATFHPIAITGLAVQFPGCGSDLELFFQNLDAGTDSSQSVPANRWRLPSQNIIDPSGSPDTIFHDRAYFLSLLPTAHWEEDLQLPPASFDPLFHLAFDLIYRCNQQLRIRATELDHVGLVFGSIALPTDAISRMAYDQIIANESDYHPYNRHVTGFSARWFAQHFQFGLGGYTLDAACASTLYAIKFACDQLQSGRAKAMVAGGLSRPDSLYNQMGFTQLKALSRSGKCSPLDVYADGLMVGEGGGLFVLKRLEDAILNQDPIFGVIRGIGLSNDREASLTAPAVEGQVRAITSAYQQASIHPDHVSYIECHATGTPKGDLTELESLSKVFCSNTRKQYPYLGSVKANVGHLLTGANSAAVAKCLLGFKYSKFFRQPNFTQLPTGFKSGQEFKVANQTLDWHRYEYPRVAGISGFGFGGINAHLVLEEYIPNVNVNVVSGSEIPKTYQATILRSSTSVGAVDSVGQLLSKLLQDEPIPRLDFIELEVGKFRISPKELAEALPQQLLLLSQIDKVFDPTLIQELNGQIGCIYVGVDLDLSTTNFCLRWQTLANDLSPDETLPPLTPDRVLGALASIAASRIARYLKVAGPAITLSEGIKSGSRVLQLALTSMANSEIDYAIIACVGMYQDPREIADPFAVSSNRQFFDTASVVVLHRSRFDGIALEFSDSAFSDEVIKLPANWHELEEKLPYLGNGDELIKLVIGHQLLLGKQSIHNNTLIPQLYNQSEQAIFDLKNSNQHIRLSAKSTTSFSSIDDCPKIYRFRGRTLAGLQINLQQHRISNEGKYGLTIIAKNYSHLYQVIEKILGSNFHEIPEGCFFSEDTSQTSQIAFLYPGSGNHYVGMGKEFASFFPHILHQQEKENQFLRNQYCPELFWQQDDLLNAQPRELLFGQVTFATLLTDILKDFHIQPNAVIGYSLGESASYFAMRIWRDRDLMWQRLQSSSLFTQDLAPPYLAAKKALISTNIQLDWVSAVLPCSALQVQQVLSQFPVCYLLIINHAHEVVIGGHRPQVLQLANVLRTVPILLEGVTLAHCELARSVEGAYRDLHTLPTSSINPDITFYSTPFQQSFIPTTFDCASSITHGLLHTLDFRSTIETAYQDGIRYFVEIGPGDSCTRILHKILDGKTYSARSLSSPRSSELQSLLSVIAELDLTDISMKIPDRFLGKLDQNLIQYPAHILPTLQKQNDEMVMDQPDSFVEVSDSIWKINQLSAAAHSNFLQLSIETQRQFSRLIAEQTELFQLLNNPSIEPELHRAEELSDNPPRQLNYEQCKAFGEGFISAVFGNMFAEVDQFPTRVRLPAGPLMLVDSVQYLEGEPLSLSHGRIGTTHFVHQDRWYLDSGLAPVCVSVEAGQADLMLSGFLGIDFQTRGLAVYRLLDAVVTFHRGLPQVGEMIQYDIHIDRFFQQGNTYLFRFRFEGTINGEPFLSMKDGCAGFFSNEELNAGKGLIFTDFQTRPEPKSLPTNWVKWLPSSNKIALNDQQVDSLRRGDYFNAFGAAFKDLSLSQPMQLPDGMLRLVHRVLEIDPTGGRYSLGVIVAEADIHPDDWFLTCHFVDDQVMPGTLMYECCLHTLRIFLMSQGLVGEEGEILFEPVAGLSSRLKCRGQVIASTQKVQYEVRIKQLGYNPHLFAIADAIMYADGKPIVEIADMSLQMTNLTLDVLSKVWSNRNSSHFDKKPAIYDTDRILAFAIGKPSEAFGEPYRIFDQERIIARLPGPPYQFLDRITAIDATPWEMKAGGIIEAQYDVPEDAWYFVQNRQDRMPFGVLLEIVLQPCGWLAAYVGSALTSPIDLSFRNLGGSAIQYVPVDSKIGTITTQVKLTRVSSSGGMIIQNYDYCAWSDGQKIYEGDTYFGFFSKEALSNQVGLRDYTICKIDPQLPLREYPQDTRFPDEMLRMIDRYRISDSGGPNNLGWIEGYFDVDPNDWFFKAHFYQDPVCPGSLGLESALQLTRLLAIRRWGFEPHTTIEAVAMNQKHAWVYRGQVIPTNQEVRVQVWPTQWSDDLLIVSVNALLFVDDRPIYELRDFTLQLRT